MNTYSIFKIRKSLHKIYILIIILLGLFVILLSYFIISANEYNKLINSQILQVNEVFNQLKTILQLVSPALGIGIEFMAQFSPYNSTIREYIKFTGMNESSISNYITDMKPLYNITNDDRLLFETQLSIVTGKNSTITDISKSDVTSEASIRPWYCPVLYTSPLNNETFWRPGLDACNLEAFVPIIDKFNDTLYKIVSSSRVQLITKFNLIDFAVRTPNGLVVLSFNPNTLFIPLKNKNIDSVLYYNGKEFYKTCEKCLNDIRFYKTITYNDDTLSFYLNFNDNYVNINLFYIILVAILFISSISITFIIQYGISINKYDDANEMLGYVNHEIRNPLNCIKGMIEISLLDIEEKNDIEIVVKNLKVAQNVVQLLSHIVNDVLDYQKLIDGKMLIINTEININEFESILFNIISSKLSEKPHIKYKFINNGITKINTDESRLIQILLNFLSNSIKFTDIGSVTLTLTSVNNNFVFSVKDTGRGILSTDMDKIFQPYKQTGIIDSLRHGGIGLGLYLCKTLIRLMHGDIGFDSEYNVGSTFWISIPNI